MIQVSFAKTEHPRTYLRTVRFPGGPELRDEVAFPLTLYHEDDADSGGGSASRPLLGSLRDLGRKVADFALGEEGIRLLSRKLEQRQHTGIQLIESRPTSELAAVPWEAMSLDGTGFVALDPRTPVVRAAESFVDSVTAITLNRPLRMAVVSAQPADLRPLGLEAEQYRFALTVAPHMNRLTLEVTEVIRATRRRLATAVQHQRYDILYFTGHGAYTGGAGFLTLEADDPRHLHKAEFLCSSDLVRLFPEGHLPALAFLNCCQSATRFPWEQGVRALQDVARQLIAAGVPDVVATLSPVFDADSQFFMDRFFASLLTAHDVSRAMALARQELSSRGITTFYRYLHLSQTTARPSVTFNARPAEDTSKRKFYLAGTHPASGPSLVRRYNALYEIESSYLSNAKAVMVVGLGGSGKTALTAILEDLLLSHYDPRLRVDRAIWLDFRHAARTDPTGCLIDQLGGVLDMAGYYLEAATLRTGKEISAIPLSRMLADKFGPNVLLTLDNCEDLLDARGHPRDADFFRFLLGIIAHTPGWKVVLATREPFRLTDEGRATFLTHTHRLPQFTPTERGALFQALAEGQAVVGDLDADDKTVILKQVAGNPWELVLFMGEFGRLTPRPNVRELVRQTHQRAGDYAYLDYYLEKLPPDSLDLVRLLAVFHDAPSEPQIGLVVKTYRDSRSSTSGGRYLRW